MDPEAINDFFLNVAGQTGVDTKIPLFYMQNKFSTNATFNFKK